MWTNSVIFIHKEGDHYRVYSHDPHELELFADKHGNLYDEFKLDDIRSDGIYQAEVGYGTWDYPKIYWIKKIADKLNWEFPKEH